MKKHNLDLANISTILYSEDHAQVNLPVCDHYTGRPKYFEKALQIRADRAFDCTRCKTLRLNRSCQLCCAKVCPCPLT